MVEVEVEPIQNASKQERSSYIFLLLDLYSTWIWRVTGCYLPPPLLQSRRRQVIITTGQVEDPLLPCFDSWALWPNHNRLEADIAAMWAPLLAKRWTISVLSLYLSIYFYCASTFVVPYVYICCVYFILSASPSSADRYPWVLGFVVRFVQWVGLLYCGLLYTRGVAG